MHLLLDVQRELLLNEGQLVARELDGAVRETEVLGRDGGEHAALVRALTQDQTQGLRVELLNQLLDFRSYFAVKIV